MAGTASREECTVILVAGANPGETSDPTYDNIAALKSNLRYLHQVSSNYGVDTTTIANLNQDIARISQQSHEQGPIPRAEYEEFRRSIGRQLIASSELIKEAIKSSNLHDDPEAEAKKFTSIMLVRARSTYLTYLFIHPPQHFLTKPGLVVEPEPR
ncbi:hypothetical protein B0H67DRAFT_610860 [Lasiosphaeris hirsuta]|uniref:Uncharacterized protein n=1 Tax=Lasiosphaeris hirsuta TaxID=260670 RepID=A0AA40AI83_9PEZI|nr:hypothetical protein B0H67DRAFT_610860 [Lasiosphaeris hirsuta]